MKLMYLYIYILLLLLLLLLLVLLHINLSISSSYFCFQVPEKHVILINLFCTPGAAKRIVSEFPNLTVLTTEIHEVTPDHFGQKYFGTDHTDY